MPKNVVQTFIFRVIFHSSNFWYVFWTISVYGWGQFSSNVTLGEHIRTTQSKPLWTW